MYPENTQRFNIPDFEDWEAGLPSINGTHRLEAGTEGNQAPVTITMFHQLHCLSIIVRQLATLDRKSHTARGDPLEGVCPVDKKSQWELTQHCMNYLRQMVLCHSHTTLETVRSQIPPSIVELAKSRYVCKDWTSVYSRWSK
ncbi:hypothetical protein DFP72DRAFT_634123 [Ephemerocybe angulata]|uniref:Uncharacterized protein n=1 Tax=Ephemerocybe angulata TaxID=980116 RepID=A0A8H6HHR7_9AGAR|nr:hypothetical protein DFP72DRAFT_634123 [Tulosesus angulatus]